MLAYRLEIAFALIGTMLVAAAIVIPILIVRRRRERLRRLGIKSYNL